MVRLDSGDVLMQPAGKRNCLCRLMEDGGGERSASGHQIPQPREVAKFWCEIVTLSASQRLAFHQLYGESALQLRTPWTRSTTPRQGQYFLFGNRRLDIVSVQNEGERNEMWSIVANEATE